MEEDEWEEQDVIEVNIDDIKICSLDELNSFSTKKLQHIHDTLNEGFVKDKKFVKLVKGFNILGIAFGVLCLGAGLGTLIGYDINPTLFNSMSDALLTSGILGGIGAYNTVNGLQIDNECQEQIDDIPIMQSVLDRVDKLLEVRKEIGDIFPEYPDDDCEM